MTYPPSDIPAGAVLVGVCVCSERLKRICQKGYRTEGSGERERDRGRQTEQRKRAKKKGKLIENHVRGAGEYRCWHPPRADDLLHLMSQI